MRHPRIQKLLNRPKVYPYANLIRTKVIALVGSIVLKLGLFKNRGEAFAERVRAYQAEGLEHTRILRDAYLNLDELPTVRKGLEAVGLKSIFETLYRNVPDIESPYTHPLQRPPFYIPGVPARTFYDASEFEWTAPLEEAYPAIKKELTHLMDDPESGFQSYKDEYGNLASGWNTFNFFFYGEKFEKNCALCPETTRVLESLPRFEKDHIMFSALNPHAVIPPHYGPINGIMRAHLPLVVPEGCYIKVGNDERTWVEGKVMAFDDSFLHQVWNHSDQVRIVLFINFWHPCFADDEIPALEAFRKAYEASPIVSLHAKYQHQTHDNQMQVKA